MIIVDAYAKLNLSLRIIRRREDGYHELDSLVQTIDLADRLIAEHGGIGLRVANDMGLPPAMDLTYRAATRVLERKETTVNLGIRLSKTIPVGAGLGGGSSDAAAALCVVDRATPPELDVAERAEIAAHLGADVSLFLVGGALRIGGVGERLRPLGTIGAPAYVLLIPPIHCDTRTVYRAWAEHARHAVWDDGLEIGRNDLLEPALACYPGLRPYHEASLGAGGICSGMSGSGSTFYIGCAEDEDAEGIGRMLETRFPEATVRIAVPTTCGHHIRTEECK